MLRYKKSFGLIFFAILLFSCSENKLSQNDKIIGTWTRVGDNYSRMKVTVEENNNIVFGKIIFLPTLAQKNGFVFNDIKWKKIRKINNNKYSLSNLDVTVNTFGDRVKEKYYDCFIYFMSKNEIKLEFKNNKKRMQHWIKYQN